MIELTTMQKYYIIAFIIAVWVAGLAIGSVVGQYRASKVWENYVTYYKSEVNASCSCNFDKPLNMSYSFGV